MKRQAAIPSPEFGGAQYLLTNSIAPSTSYAGTTLTNMNLTNMNLR